MQEPIFAPREIFEQMLQYMVIPAFDLIVELPEEGIIVVKRKIPPYDNVWALPGLRMYKGESIDQTMRRIAKQEVGLDIDPGSRRFVGQYVGKFKTEHNRQDLSTAYVVKAKTKDPTLNKEHFSSMKIVTKYEDLPKPFGAMYAFYLRQYFNR